jgi:predicted MPP superfamily phosphohydrolase
MHWLLTGQLSIERVEVAIAQLPDSLIGLRLVQLSDFHFDGLRLSKKMLQEAISVSNAMEPDLVLLTGDYVTDDPKWVHELAKELKYLSARCGIFAILGNHDLWYSHSRAEITEALEAIGIQVLWNQVAHLFDAKLPLVGLADSYSKEFDPATVLPDLDPGSPRIVLSHNPDTAEALRPYRVDLQLSGHTHGGQVVIPGLGPLPAYCDRLYAQVQQKLTHWSPLFKASHYVVQRWEWSEGLHQIGSNQLYVNRGLGTYLPGRLFCPPEVTVITLVQGNS